MTGTSASSSGMAVSTMPKTTTGITRASAFRRRRGADLPRGWPALRPGPRRARRQRRDDQLGQRIRIPDGLEPGPALAALAHRRNTSTARRPASTTRARRCWACGKHATLSPPKHSPSLSKAPSMPSPSPWPATAGTPASPRAAPPSPPGMPRPSAAPPNWRPPPAQVKGTLPGRHNRHRTGPACRHRRQGARTAVQ
jgi:hypothetical protein